MKLQKWSWTAAINLRAIKPALKFNLQRQRLSLKIIFLSALAKEMSQCELFTDINGADCELRKNQIMAPSPFLTLLRWGMTSTFA